MQDDSSVEELRERAIELKNEHFKFDQEVVILHKRKWLSSKEKERLKHLKKLKLSRKDQIRAIKNIIENDKG